MSSIIERECAFQNVLIINNKNVDYIIIKVFYKVNLCHKTNTQIDFVFFKLAFLLKQWILLIFIVYKFYLLRLAPFCHR